MALITLSGGQSALVDEADFSTVSQYNWHLDDDGYALARVKRGEKWTTVRMHALITGAKETDHENHNKLDNRRSNLRPSTRTQNQGNRIANRIGKTSKYKGVCWHKQKKRWRAQLRNAPKTLWLGEFKSDIEAAKAYDRAARNYFGEFALTNFNLTNS